MALRHGHISGVAYVLTARGSVTPEGRGSPGRSKMPSFLTATAACGRFLFLVLCLNVHPRFRDHRQQLVSLAFLIERLLQDTSLLIEAECRAYVRTDP